MDSSTFSLEKATAFVYPHLGSLPFDPLNKIVVNRDDGYVIEKVKVRLRLWRRFVSQPCDLEGTDMMKFFHVGFARTYYNRLCRVDDGCKLSLLDQTGLLLRRPLSGQDCFWYVVRIRYVPFGEGSFAFDSSVGSIVHLEITSSFKDVPVFMGYWDRFKKDVKFWSRKSIRAREDHIANLEKLVAKCDG